MHRPTPISIAAILSLVLGCSKADSPKPDTIPANPQASSAVSGRPAMPGALSKALGTYTPEEFYSFVQGLQYSGGHERQRRCKNATGCDGAAATRRTQVWVEAITTQDSLAAATVPQFGVVYMHAANRGDAQESRYGFLPGKQFQYYVVITGDSASGMSWHLEQLDVTGGARKLTEIGSGKFIGCNHKWTAGAQADFKTCANSAALHDSTVRLGLVLQGGDDDPFWITCAAGCCIPES